MCKYLLKKCSKSPHRRLHYEGIYLSVFKPLTSEVNNTDYLFTMSPGKVVRCNSADEQSLVWESRLTRLRLSWLDNWVRASPKWQILPGFSSIQWLVCTKRGQRKDNQWTGDRVMGSEDSSVCLVMSADDVCTIEKEVTETECIS